MSMKTVTQVYDFVSAKEEYIRFCRDSDNDLPIFAQPWYLDVVCEKKDDWRVIIYKENGRIVAAFPFEYKKTKKGAYTIKNPWQAPRLGIWIDYGNRKTNRERENLENNISQFVISNLPRYDDFSVAFDSRFSNWREFYNNGFRQETRYSYVVEKEVSLQQEYFPSISRHKRRDITRLDKELDVFVSNNVDEFIDFLKKSYADRNRELEYPIERLRLLLNAVINKNRGRVYFAKDKNEVISAAHVVFFDKRRGYSMYGTFDPNRKTTARALLTYRAIIDCAKEGLDYDFEGSMIPGVAEYNSSFNSKLEPYFFVSKQSPRMRFYTNLRENISILRKRVLYR